MNRFARTARSVAMSLRMVILSANFWIAVALIFGVLFAEIAEDVFSGYAGDGPDAFGAAYPSTSRCISAISFMPHLWPARLRQAEVSSMIPKLVSIGCVL